MIIALLSINIPLWPAKPGDPLEDPLVLHFIQPGREVFHITYLTEIGCLR